MFLSSFFIKMVIFYRPFIPTMLLSSFWQKTKDNKHWSPTKEYPICFLISRRIFLSLSNPLVIICSIFWFKQILFNKQKKLIHTSSFKLFWLLLLPFVLLLLELELEFVLFVVIDDVVVVELLLVVAVDVVWGFVCDVFKFLCCCWYIGVNIWYCGCGWNVYVPLLSIW